MTELALSTIWSPECQEEHRGPCTAGFTLPPAGGIKHGNVYVSYVKHEYENWLKIICQKSTD